MLNRDKILMRENKCLTKKLSTALSLLGKEKEDEVSDSLGKAQQWYAAQECDATM